MNISAFIEDKHVRHMIFPQWIWSKTFFLIANLKNNITLEDDKIINYWFGGGVSVEYDFSKCALTFENLYSMT